MKNKRMIFAMVFAAILMLYESNCSAQPKLFKKSDIAPMSLSFGAGHLNGHREQILYHPNQLFEMFPNLNRNFYDIRVQNEPGFLNTEWDADHTFELVSKTMMVVAVVIKIGEKKKWYWYLWDFVKYMGSFKFGEFTSYNLIHKNKL